MFIHIFNHLDSNSLVLKLALFMKAVCVCVFPVYHMKEDGWIKVCMDDVSQLLHGYKKDMF